MKLKNIRIQNYRSIEDITFDIEKLADGSYTYGFIGVNEAGKSSILKAIALKDGHFPLSPKDFKNRDKDVFISFRYFLEKSDEAIKADLITEDDEADFDEIEYSISYNFSTPTKPIKSYLGITKDKSEILLDNAETILAEQETIFWTYEEKFLISNPINLESFSNSPESVSVPLKNCFLLAGFENIKETITNIKGDSTEKQYLQEKLGMEVTKHIQSVWPNHPIEITFDIDGGVINFHVKDTGVSRAKTASQRSDGFRQFVSFLLTISAENKNDELSNTILLLDEPETHLHPQAQIHLLNELNRISTNNRNNIVLFATHSNFMIDKKDLSRNYRVVKESDKTLIHRFEKQSSTYASITYDVFGIATSDFHNELYSKLHDNFLESCTESNPSNAIKHFDEAYFHQQKGLKKTFHLKTTPNAATLPTYIRNCIHHPDKGRDYNDEQLRTSIELMITYLAP